MRNERRFQSRRARRVLGGAVAVGLLAASGVLVGVGIASSPTIALVTTASSTTSTTTTIPTSGKVTICHHTHSKGNPFVTITINVRAWRAHLKHGDTVGACVRPTTTTTTTTTTSTTTTTTTTTTGGTTTAGSAHTVAPRTSGPGRSGQHGQGNSQGHGRGHR
jgi:hypothetical protein